MTEAIGYFYVRSPPRFVSVKTRGWGVEVGVEGGGGECKTRYISAPTV